MTDQQPDLPSNQSEPSKGELTRQQIIQAALPLFSAQGYHGTSMRQIAEQAGIALGGIYNHFGSKEEIFRAVSFAYHPIHTILPSLEASRGETVADEVHYSADRMYDALTDGQDFMNLMFIEVVEFKGKHFPDIFAEMFPRALGFSQRLREKRGNLREDLPLPVMVVTFIGLMFAFFLYSRTFGTLADLGRPRKVLHQVVDIYLHGILSPETDRRTDQ